DDVEARFGEELGPALELVVVDAARIRRVHEAEPEQEVGVVHFTAPYDGGTLSRIRAPTPRSRACPATRRRRRPSRRSPIPPLQPPRRAARSRRPRRPPSRRARRARRGSPGG